MKNPFIDRIRMYGQWMKQTLIQKDQTQKKAQKKTDLQSISFDIISLNYNNVKPTKILSPVLHGVLEKRSIQSMKFCLKKNFFSFWKFPLFTCDQRRKKHTVTRFRKHKKNYSHVINTIFIFINNFITFHVHIYAHMLLRVLFLSLSLILFLWVFLLWFIIQKNVIVDNFHAVGS